MAEKELSKLKSDNDIIFQDSLWLINASSQSVKGEEKDKKEESILFSNNLNNIVEVLTKWSQKEGILIEQDKQLLQFFKKIKESRDEKQAAMQKLYDEFSKNNQSPYDLRVLIKTITKMALLLPETYFKDSSLNSDIAHKVKDLCILIQNCSIKTFNSKTFEQVKKLKKSILELESLSGIHWFGSIFDKCLTENDFEKIGKLVKKYNIKDFSFSFEEIKTDYESLMQLQTKHQQSLNDTSDIFMATIASDIKNFFKRIDEQVIFTNEESVKNYKARVQKQLDEEERKKEELEKYLKGQEEEKKKQVQENFLNNQHTNNLKLDELSSLIPVMRSTLRCVFDVELAATCIYELLQRLQSVLPKLDPMSCKPDDCKYFHNALDELKKENVFQNPIFSGKVLTLYNEVLELLKNKSQNVRI